MKKPNRRNGMPWRTSLQCGKPGNRKRKRRVKNNERGCLCCDTSDWGIKPRSTTEHKAIEFELKQEEQG